MHVIFNLALLGFAIMIALAMANFVIVVVLAALSLPVTGISALIDKFKHKA